MSGTRVVWRVGIAVFSNYFSIYKLKSKAFYQLCAAVIRAQLLEFLILWIAG
jgi:hypothetical protein